MTLKALAEKVKLSVSYLSGIERDKYPPSLETISFLSEFFKISISELIGEEHKYKIKIIKKNERKTITNDDNKVMISFLSKPATIDSKLEFKLIQMCPKTVEGKWIHSHSGEEACMVLEGDACVNIDGHVFFLEQGDTIHFDSSLMHVYENKTESSLKLIVCTSPPNFTPAAYFARKKAVSGKDPAKP